MNRQRHLGGIEVTRAMPNDSESIVVLQRETWLNTYPNTEYDILREDVAAKFADMPTRITQRREILISDDGSAEWVAKDNRTVVGWASAKRGKINELRALYVHPDYQGKKVGTKLISRVLEWLGDGVDIKVGVAAYNTKAINFYKKWGFVESGKGDDDAAMLPNGKIIPEILMVKRSI